MFWNKKQKSYIDRMKKNEERIAARNARAETRAQEKAAKEEAKREKRNRT